MRFLTVIDQDGAKHGLNRSHLVAISGNLWRRIYSEDADISQPGSVAEVSVAASTMLCAGLNSFFVVISCFLDYIFLFS